MARAKSFPKSRRLLKTDEFSSVFRFRSRLESEHFQVYAKPNQGPAARLGVVIGKAVAPRAVDRNYFKRSIREAFRKRQERLQGLDMVVRVSAKIVRVGARTVMEELPGLLMETAKKWRG